MVSPPAPPHAPSQTWRSSLDELPHKMRLASVVSGSVVLASVILVTLIAAHVGAHALIYPPPAIQLSLANAGTTIHPLDTVTFNVKITAGRQLTYRWDFGDGAPSAMGARVAHAYTAYGYYVVTCRAVDPTGQRTSSEVTVTVVPPAPQAKFSVTHDRAYSYIVTVDASASTGTDLHYYWDFGDGVSSGSGLDQQATHYYQHPGTYGLTLTVVDVAGQSNATTVLVAVSATNFH